MNMAQRLRLLIVLIFCCALPAYANNPPQPDGLFSILLIFPMVILGRRIAGVPSIQRSLWQRVATTLVLTVCVVLCMAGTGLALFPLLIIFAYGIRRVVQIIARGQGRKRLLIAAAVIAWMIFGVADYLASITYYPSAPAFESSAISRLRTLSNAENEFKNPTYSKRALSQVYGTVAELRSAQLLDDTFAPGAIRNGYLFGEIIGTDKNQFLFYAVPGSPYRPDPDWLHFVPGGSLLWAFFRKQETQGTGKKSFAVDETGVIRFTPQRDAQSPVTREEASRWETLY